MIAVWATTLLAERPPTTRQPGRDVVVRQLAAGKLLVAARRLPDPNFTDTIVLLVAVLGDGAAGLVVNRRSDFPLLRALPGVTGRRGRRDGVHRRAGLARTVSRCRGQRATPAPSSGATCTS